MSSRAARKRAKRKFISLAGGVTVDQKPTGRDRTQTHQPQEDPTITARKARMTRLAAANVPSPEKHVMSDMAGCEAGIALLADDISADERADLWRAVTHIRRTWVAYGRAIGAPNRYAQCLRILLPAERFEVNASSPAFDSRPQEDRDRSAVAAYMRTQGWLMRGSARDLQACIGCVVDDQPGHDWQAVKRALSLVSAGLSGANKIT